MGSRLAIVPILWNNDDLPELTQPETRFEEIASACEQLGFDGVEMGSNFPEDATALRSALKRRHLALAAARFGPDLLKIGERSANLEAAHRVAQLLARVEALVLVVPEVLRPERNLFAGSAGPAQRASRADFDMLVAGVEEVARRIQPLGVTCAFHNHAGSFVETEEEIDRFLADTDPGLVKFCLDTGHATVGGANPVALARRYASRIVHVHLKDVDPAVLSELRTKRFGFLQGVRSFLFCEPGRGCARIAETVAVLKESGFQGWYVAEQDTTRLGPLESARISHDFLAPLISS